MKKGISIPINALIILAIGIIVLLGLVVFFTGGLNPASESVRCENKLRSGCTNLATVGGCKEKPIGWSTGYRTLKEGVRCTLGWSEGKDVPWGKAQELCCQGEEMELDNSEDIDPGAGLNGGA